MSRTADEPIMRLAIEQRSGSQPARIHIIGGPGSGKSTLSRQIAQRLDAPVFELDHIAGAGPAPAFRMERSLSQRLDDVERIAALSTWITEGSFLWWTEALLRAADIIVWLDLPLSVAMRRIVTRHIREYLGDIAQQSSLRQKLQVLRYPHLRHLAQFVPYTTQYYRRLTSDESAGERDLDSGWALTRAETASWLEGFASKVIRCSQPIDVEHLLTHLTASRPV
ncbi:MAG TPA: hypothetical protein VF510_23230 [Ktedonobacterales bacterium]